MTPEDWQRHYQPGLEAQRLGAGAGRIEFERTQAVIRRYLGEPPAVICDVGGGPGAYAVWLLTHGYSVHLVDPVSVHVEEARQALAEVGSGNFSVTVGDARSLEQGDASVDSVLLLGPLYHLTERDERVAALREAYRVLKPRGLVFAAAISRFASLFDGMARDLLDEPEFQSIVERDLKDGSAPQSERSPGLLHDRVFPPP